MLLISYAFVDPSEVTVFVVVFDADDFYNRKIKNWLETLKNKNKYPFAVYFT